MDKLRGLIDYKSCKTTRTDSENKKIELETETIDSLSKSSHYVSASRDTFKILKFPFMEIKM